jgi:hypothetical protein
MTIIGELRFLERMQFFNGQRLFASDLQALESDNRERRWLHNVSLHQPGVGSGYAIAGNKGDREVVITPGYAIDSLGREIILTEQRVEPIPAVADDGDGKSVYFDLTVSYPDDEALEESELREGVCLPRGVIRLREQPVFCWVRLNADGQPRDKRLKVQVEEGIKIRLARAEILDCKLYSPISTAKRRNARPPQQPYIASGQYAPDDKWKRKTTKPGEEVTPYFEIDVDTSAAGFVTPPCYTAQIVGERFFQSTRMPEFKDVFDKVDADEFLLEGFAEIIDSQANAFTLQLLMPGMNFGSNLRLNPDLFFDEQTFDGLSFPKFLAFNQWKLVWLGVEL